MNSEDQVVKRHKVNVPDINRSLVLSRKKKEKSRQDLRVQGLDKKPHKSTVAVAKAVVKTFNP